MILVDSCVWSLAIRRKREPHDPRESSAVAEWRRIVERGEAALAGPIRQEVLSGVHGDREFERLRGLLEGFEDLPLLAGDYVAAARTWNRCRAAGVAGSPTDVLLCAVSLRTGTPLFTTDGDFSRYARVIPLRLHRFG